MSYNIFLIEIETEELPLKSQNIISKILSIKISTKFKKFNLFYYKLQYYATPRRIAIKIKNLNKKYIINFYNKNILFKIIYICKCKNLIKNLIFNIINNLLKNLSIFKIIKWNNDKIKFIRPINNIVILLNNQLIKGNILNINIKQILIGHRFIGKKKIYLNQANHYSKTLSTLGNCISNYKKRKIFILNNIKSINKQLNSISNINKNIIEETTSLTEYPVLYYGKFKNKFLKIPNYFLIYIMEYNQKYIPIFNFFKKFKSYFIFISNIKSNNIRKIIKDNEQVLYQKFIDINFFINFDKKILFIKYLKKLKNILFKKKIGTLYDKSNRIKYIAYWLADKIKINKNQTKYASLLSKCDLITKMVFEFNNMKGIIGMYYANYNNEPKIISLSQKEQYLPKFKKDSLTSTKMSSIISISDKIDTLVGVLGIKNYKIKKNNDPFALRRNAIGILRIIIKKKIKVNLIKLIKKTINQYNLIIIKRNTKNKIFDFIIKKLYFWYKKRGYKSNIIKSVLINKINYSLIDINKRIKIIKYFDKLNKLNKLIKINKRISVIIKKSKINIKYNFKLNLLINKSEIKLTAYLIILRNKIKILFKKCDYKTSLIKLTMLYEKIKIFFKKVKIINNNLKICKNRLILINKIKILTEKLANISLLINE